MNQKKNRAKQLDELKELQKKSSSRITNVRRERRRVSRRTLNKNKKENEDKKKSKGEIIEKMYFNVDISNLETKEPKKTVHNENTEYI